jgi:hypothetical protein
LPTKGAPARKTWQTAVGFVFSDIFKLPWPRAQAVLPRRWRSGIEHRRKPIRRQGRRDVGRRPSKRFESLSEQFNASGDISSTKYGGTNLGLSLSKKLCHLLQGDITVDSELGKGSCFTIRIPASAGAGPAEDDAQDEEVAAALASAEARSRDILTMLAVAGSGADARPSNPSAKKDAANA